MNKTILLVDDDDAVRLTLSANLELEGFEIHEADSATEALKMLRAGLVPDLVLSDIRMPRVSGVELFRSIKSEFPEVPVVLMTAFAYQEQIEGAISEGVFTIISKPFALHDLVPTLERAIRRPMVLVVEALGPRGEEIAKSLARRGLRVRHAGGPGLASAAVQAENVDVCILDLQSTEPEGQALVRAASAIRPPVTIIACTQGSGSDQVSRLAGAGVRLFVAKPVKTDQLMEVIAQARSRVEPAA